MATKAPAKKTTTPAHKETVKHEAKHEDAHEHKHAHDEHNHAHEEHEHTHKHEEGSCCGNKKKSKDECCGKGDCCKDDLDEVLHEEMEDSCCGGHEHAHEHEHVQKTVIKPTKKNTSGIVEDGNMVSIHYTGTLDSGETFDSSLGREPIEFVLGSQSVIPGFEKAVLGMKKGAKKKVVIETLDAYGDSNPELFQEVPREALGDITPEEGMMLALHHPMSPAPVPVKIVKVTPETVTIDMNHPLAGQRLHFDLELVDIK